MPVRLITALCLGVLWGAFVPGHGLDLTAAIPQSVEQEKPDEVLAKAKQIYSEDGPKSALPCSSACFRSTRPRAIAAARRSRSA
jgi:hypothetical protein